jgi:tetratricopeptide (TPR) repeat protein
MRGDRVFRWIACGLVVAVVGCGTSQPAPKVAAKKPAARQADIEEQLKSALYQLQPENLNIDSRLDDAVSVLNHWWSAVQAADLEPTGLTPPPIPAERLPEGWLSRLERDTYDLEDGAHVRAAYLARNVANRLADQTEDELERVVRVFEWVCRNVTLAADDDPLPPMTFYELMIVGRGRAADRAWVFGEILKQLKIDAVVLQAREGQAAVGPPIVGVILGDAVYLFDPQLGLPIPRGDEPPSPHIRRPATLREIREHPHWLKALSLRTDQPYEPTGEQLTAAAVQVITSPTSWTRRMWNLEQLLPSEALCSLYDPPAALGDAPGLFTRVAAADPHWTADALQVWTYPLQRQAEFAAVHPQANPQVFRLLQATLLPFEVPFEPKLDEKKEKVVQIAQTKQQLKTRTLQLQGRYAPAIAGFVGIRQIALSPPPDPAWNPLYQRAAEDAFYWTCVAKYEQGEYESAVATLGDYLKRHTRGGRWVGPAWQLLAECQRELGQLPQAIQALKGATGDEAYRNTNALLARRWSEASASTP